MGLILLVQAKPHLPFVSGLIPSTLRAVVNPNTVVGLRTKLPARVRDVTNLFGNPGRRDAGLRRECVGPSPAYADEARQSLEQLFANV